ncbi:MAG TPA: hypothetical protein PLK76_02985 [bacterium]|nr:hypothetical protein [bacterium]
MFKPDQLPVADNRIEIPFKHGQNIRVKRSPESGGQIEDGWIFVAFNEVSKKAIVEKRNPDGTGIQKEVDLNKLISWQEQGNDIREKNIQPTLENEQEILAREAKFKGSMQEIGRFFDIIWNELPDDGRKKALHTSLALIMRTGLSYFAGEKGDEEVKIVLEKYIQENLSSFS